MAWSIPLSFWALFAYRARIVWTLDMSQEHASVNCVVTVCQRNVLLLDMSICIFEHMSCIMFTLPGCLSNI